MNIVQIDLQSSSKDRPGSTEKIALQGCIPVGTFAGSDDFVVRIRDGRPTPSDTGDQGGGQN
jgi:hypothetical protein